MDLRLRYRRDQRPRPERTRPRRHGVHRWRHRSRHLGRTACGTVLTPDVRDKLVLLEAYRNRIFRVPPPVRIVPDEIRSAFPSLEQLYDKLAED